VQGVGYVVGIVHGFEFGFGTLVQEQVGHAHDHTPHVPQEVGPLRGRFADGRAYLSGQVCNI